MVPAAVGINASGELVLETGAVLKLLQPLTIDSNARQQPRHTSDTVFGKAV